VREQLLQVLRDEALWAGTFLMIPSASQPLEHIRSAMGNCMSCRLGSTRKNIVFGEGDPRARIMFIGEGPGAFEDETGRPFVGRAGSLLTDIIEKGMKLKRQEVYIANIVKCRPPENRDPQPDEIGRCIGYLDAQIMAIKPLVIIALGRIAAHTLLESTTPISRLRGTFHEYKGIKTMPTFHPSYLLQNPSKKRDVWEDIKKVMEHLELPL
jgi:uracil-DNA glycosylase